ncbi:ATP-binding protein [Saccharopolyspora sp. K220]|uniref:ATP-binding protein n=1 Tax=Saccharopolyspora soli TaxID=2926618 RepID=UPI001F592E0B|nr:ATP-binding protein [Saccharopolyspora soli]MCI2424354.1 ATP-binding protein [Saccharopolyspora soli]
MSTHTPAHHRRDRPPLRPALLAFLAALVVTGGACGWASAVAPVGSQLLVAWYGGVLSLLLAIASSVAVRGVQLVRHLRSNAAMIDADIARLTYDVLPTVAQRVREGTTADAAVAEVAQPFDASHRQVIRAVAQELGTGERMRAAAMATCANAAGRMQALSTSMLADLREMEDRHDEDVLADLLRLDHSTAQAGRLADSIAVLTGARSGRRWTKPIVMESILRGAMGRISAYQRIRSHSTSTVAIVGYAAEGVMHVLAELMDNAARFSPPAEEVHVYVEEVHTGVVVTIEDSGLVMSAAALARAERAVSTEPLDLTTMSGTRLGLAVVGCLARKHDLTVSFRSSSRGGTGVVVMIPRQLITQPRREITRVPRIAPEAPAEPVEAETSAPVPDSADSAPESDDQPNDLPKRRRGRTLAASRSAAAPKAPEPDRPRPDAGARFGAFRNARRDSSSTADDSTR